MLLPDPAEDAIIAVFYCFQSDNDNIGNGRAEDRQVGVIAVGTPELRRLLGPTTYTLEIVETELDLLNTLLDKVRYTWDPEIIVGYEIQYLSWGYLLERAEVKYSESSLLLFEIPH
jgi:DNA polymerase zeta